MQWFGKPWGALVNEECEQIQTPDWPCADCGRHFRAEDRGVVMPYVEDPSGRGMAAYHLRCFTANLGIADPGG